jgi:hypothetical protein
MADLAMVHLSCPLHVSNKQVHHHEATSVHATYSIFHAKIMLKIMWIVYIYIVIESIDIFMYFNAGFSKTLK